VQFTIERLRTLVLLAGVLLLAATVAFLAVGKWKNPFNRRDLPQRLGLNIQQESNGVTFSHAMGAHSQFKIHASKVVQLKQGNALLHDVKIELYGEDGSRVDRIEGSEFEYNQKDGTATATGPVEITLMRPGVAPAIAPKATPGQALGNKDNPLNTAARAAAAGEVKVKTNGLAFNWNTGIATTAQHVDFSTAQGAGSAMGATYDSKEGHLVLDRAVELRTQRAGEAVAIHASHAEFERGDMACHLRAATADYRDGQASADDARIEFRANGSVVRLDATGGFRMSTANGGRLEAAQGSLEFDEHNQPRHGRMQGGVSVDSTAPGRKAHGTAPSAELEFTSQGNLRHAHLEKGVELNSEEEGRTAGAHPEPLRVHRIWRSSIADVEFRAAGRGQVEPAALRGTGGVIVSSQSQRGNATPVLARLAADQVDSAFGPNSALSQMTGAGHASMEQTTASGARQTASGDRLEAHFSPASAAAQGSAVQVQSAVLDGHVVLVQTPPVKAGAQPQPPLRAFAGRAAYASDGQWLHLTLSPRVDDGGLQLTATKIDISQDSGDAYAHGNVKATWTQSGKSGQAVGGLSPDSQEPAHVIAAEAQVHQAIGNSDGVATFRGHARLWQQANSVAAPTIVLAKDRQTLEAHSTDRGEPVRVVLLSEAGKTEGKQASATPSVLRVRGGDLRYSGESRVALMQSGSLGPVVAETATATSQSDQVELKLLQAASHSARPAGQGQVERMTARGRVALSSQGRRGTGEQLVYTGATGEYVLTGTATAPPRMTDPVQGSVTGAALIFHSRDDSVSIEGGGRSTTTRTTAPR
jgi:lipopolysaccharide export system protein LptA